MVGPSGCGKSTLLRILAGLEEPDTGQVLIADQVVNDLSPKLRDISMVFQSYALYPHMNVRENLSFPLKMRKLNDSEIRARIDEVAAMLDLTDLLDRKPAQLSGGQKQRVAMGRAMARRPQVLLFDEPLSNLDAQLRVRVRAEIALLHRKIGSTVIYVTHDQVEAMTLADRIAVLNRGTLEQVGRPMDVFQNPKTRFVASFIGTPPMNFLSLSGLGLRDLKTPAKTETIGLRAEHLKLGHGASGLIRLGRGEVVLIEPLGSTAHVHLRLSTSAGPAMLLAEIRDSTVTIKDELDIFADPSKIFFFDTAGARLELEPTPKSKLESEPTQ